MNTSLLLLLFFFTLFWPFRGLDFGVNLTDQAIEFNFDIVVVHGILLVN